MPDWIDMYMKETNGIRSPEVFRLWSGIATIAGTLERRVWTHTDNGLLYPNLYVILTGTPAAGKGLCINTARGLWASVTNLHLGPDNPTKASFMDCLEAAMRVGFNGSVYSAMSVACREFGVLIPKYDEAFLNDLTDLYDNPPIYTAPRRTAKSVTLNKPTINILAGVTPDYLHDLMPETAWGQGFTSRLLFIYGTRPPLNDRNVFKKREEINTKNLVDKLKELFNEAYGEMVWDQKAQNGLNKWINSGMEPVPNYGRLTHYIGRRDVHLLKLAMISSISSDNGLRVREEDFERARDWLLKAETVMPDVFRAMAQKSDAQLIRDLHWHIYTIYSRVAINLRKPVNEKELWKFLEERVPSERIQKVIETSLRTGWFARGIYPDEYIPRTIDTIADQH